MEKYSSLSPINTKTSINWLNVLTKQGKIAVQYELSATFGTIIESYGHCAEKTVSLFACYEKDN